MGYRSDVNISVPFDGIEVLNNLINEKIKKFEEDETITKDSVYTYNLLNTANIKLNKEFDYAIISISDIKWDNWFTDVKVLSNALLYMEDYNMDYNILVLGEDSAVLELKDDAEGLPRFEVITTIAVEDRADELEYDGKDLISKLNNK